jgi:hypothetical protein
VGVYGGDKAEWGDWIESAEREGGRVFPDSADCSMVEIIISPQNTRLLKNTT